MKAAAYQDWEDTDHFREWLRLARRNNQNNMSEKENPPNFIPTESEPKPLPLWPGDKTILPGEYPDPKRDETTTVPLVH